MSRKNFSLDRRAREFGSRSPAHCLDEHPDLRPGYYDSGNVQQGSMDVPLLADAAGTYYVIFNNRLPAATAKNVKANMSLTYYIRWWPGMDE